MGKPTGFQEYNRQLPPKRQPGERIKDYNEFEFSFSRVNVEKQAARCMDCGIPFCHSGCPLGNNIPDFNDQVYKQDWRAAYEILISTNNFPEFTGRICPAPCEAACVLSINKEATAIETIEKHIIERAYAEGWVKAMKPVERTGKRIAVIGSGPAGLAAADQLNLVGHDVTVFERADKIGGLLRYGIPDFKLDKAVIDRRIALMEEAGVSFRTNANVGENVAVNELLDQYDILLLTGGSTIARDMPTAGRNAAGVEFAMDFLRQQNKRVAGIQFADEAILATGKNVVVIGGGDTGSDCVGTSIRQQAASVLQIELLPQPPATRSSSTPWPAYPHQMRTSSSQQEGCERQWSVLTKEFLTDKKGKLRALRVVDIEWKGREFSEKPETLREIPCELALLAVGFVHPQHEGMLQQLGIKLDARGNVDAPRYQSSNPKVFAAGDMRRGQSLVVHAISEGREAARTIDIHLMGSSVLESKDSSLMSII